MASVATLAIAFAGASDPLNATLAFASACTPAPKLDATHHQQHFDLPGSISVDSWLWQTPNSGANMLAPEGSKITVATANLRKANLVALHNGFPELFQLNEQAASQGVQVAINGDLFDTDMGFPVSAVIENGKVIYGTNKMSKVFGLADVALSATSGYRTTGTIKLGTKAISITGVNQAQPGADSAVIYSSAYAGRVAPRGAETVLVVKGKVKKIYAKGADLSTKLGTVLQLRGRYAASLSKIKAGMSVKLALPPRPKTQQDFVSDALLVKGTLKVSGATFRIDSVNSRNPSQNRATVYDSSYGGRPPAGQATIVLDGNNRVAAVYDNGASVTVWPTQHVVQINGTDHRGSLQVDAGDQATLDLGYSSFGHNSLLFASGRGLNIMKDSLINYACATHPVGYRPRSAIGWNKDGQIWLITSSLGLSIEDFGTRRGGSTVDQMAEFLQQLGATDAVTLDGGDSTEFDMAIGQPGHYQRLDVPDDAWRRELAVGWGLASR